MYIGASDSFIQMTSAETRAISVLISRERGFVNRYRWRHRTTPNTKQMHRKLHWQTLNRFHILKIVAVDLVSWSKAMIMCSIYHRDFIISIVTMPLTLGHDLVCALVV
jgi:hypothetical protein